MDSIHRPTKPLSLPFVSSSQKEQQWQQDHDPSMRTVAVTTTCVVLICTQFWFWWQRRRRWRTNSNENHNNNNDNQASYSKQQQQQQRPPLTSRSRLLQEFNPLPNDLTLVEEDDNDDDRDNHHKEQATTTTTTIKQQEPHTEENVETEKENKYNTNVNQRSDPPSSQSQQGGRQEQQQQQQQQSQQQQQQQQQQSLCFKNPSHDHPGLAHFWYWCDIESSLYRIYNVRRRDHAPDDDQAIVPPYIPKSRRGTVQIHMVVTNECQHRSIQVYWLNYQGAEQSKGIIRPHRQWTQYSWMEHPWIFRDADTQQVLLHYIPDRILPVTVMDQPYQHDNENDDNNFDSNPYNTTTTKTGVHRFTIRDPPSPSNHNNNDHDDGTESPYPFVIAIDDPVLPFPAQYCLTTIEQGLEWTVRHMLRITESSHSSVLGGASWELILKYLTNILLHPNEPQYRRIRIANRVFQNDLWNTPARGIFLLAGFVEHGAYLELGTNHNPFPHYRIRELSEFVASVERWKRQWPTLVLLPEQQIQQPEGALDGHTGRAGFGVAGSMRPS